MSTAVNQRLSVENELSNLAIELLETFSALDTERAPQLDTRRLLKNYIRSVTRCGLAAGRSGSVELQDHCVNFQAILKSLLNEPAERVAQYQAVLEQWPMLLMSNLNCEHDDTFLQQLDELLTSTQWPQAGETELKQSAGAAHDYISSPATEKDAASDAQQDLHAELLDSMDALYTLNPDTPDTERHRVILECADKLELFAVSAAAAQRFGLMDVAQLCQAAIRSRTVSLTPGSPGFRYLLDLHKTMADYLLAGEQTRDVARLLVSLQQFTGPEQLNEDERDALSQLLNADNHVADDETQVVVEDIGSPLADSPDTGAQTSPPERTNPPEYTELSPQAQELLQLVATEFEPLTTIFASHLHTLLDPSAGTAERQTSALDYIASVQRFVDVFDTIKLDGLRQVFMDTTDYLRSLAQHPLDETDDPMWLADWPAHVLNYLHDPAAHADALIQHLQSATSPLRMNMHDALVHDLRNPQIDSGEDDAAPRQTVATDEDVSLQLPDDVNPQLLESLLQELPQQTAEFSRVITNIVQGRGSLQDIETAQRLAHTLKGAANTVGVAGIANLTHHLEDILLAFTREHVLPAAPLTASLQDAADVLEMMSESLVGMSPPPQAQAFSVLQQVLDWANQIDLNGLPQMQQPVAANVPPQSDPPVATSSVVTSDTTLRISTQSVDDTLRLIGESTIVNAQLQESLHRSLAHNRAIHTQSTLFQQLAFELEQLIDIRGMHDLLSGANNSAFDVLEMDQYNELHTLTRRMVEAATDTRTLTQYAEDELKQLDALLHQQKRHTKDTQEVVMKTRMLPVQTIVPRLQRSVRQACRLSGKQADLVINGAETLLDNDILSQLADPLMHILRNAIDHGIETADQRTRLGKPQTGLITLAFSREGEHILIRCQDDGGGLDLSAIRRIALEKGLLHQDEIITNESLTRLIFISGLTTREQTTQLSGRGIGMDAVYNQVNKMKGTIRVSSESGKGVQVEILLPATLVTLHGILVQVDGQVMAIANRGVEQILYADDGHLQEDQVRTLTYHYKDDRYHAYYLEDLLGFPRPQYAIDEVNRPAMLLTNTEGDTVAILIERILSTQDVVIKKLGPYAPVLSGVEGVTILGDGSVAAVMDLGVVLANLEYRDALPRLKQSDEDGIQSGSPKVLVVDDSLSARNSLAEFMRDTGFRVCTARDGMDAITQLEHEAPDILLVDMEMPRMNGLELAAYVRANHATQTIPIIMITSRASDKHREEARKAGVNAYLVKPYSESEVLDQISAQLRSVFSPSSTMN